MNQPITEMQKTALIQAATEALKNPYPTDAAQVFASAVLTDSGNMYSSAQYFSDTYSLTLHAEQATLAHAAAHGESKIVAIAITCSDDTDELTYPCHMCKQLLYESSRRSGIPMNIILFNKRGRVQEIDLDEMMTYVWPPRG